jgi:hypothetical protein
MVGWAENQTHFFIYFPMTCKQDKEGNSEPKQYTIEQEELRTTNNGLRCSDVMKTVFSISKK